MTMTDAPVTAAGWDEKAHPRGEHGKFRKLDEIMGDLSVAARGAPSDSTMSTASQKVSSIRSAISRGKRAQARTELKHLEVSTNSPEVKALAQEAQSRLQPVKVGKGVGEAKPGYGAVVHEVHHPDHGHIGSIEKHIDQHQVLGPNGSRIAIGTTQSTSYRAIPKGVNPYSPSARRAGGVQDFRTRAEAEHHLAEHADARAIEAQAPPVSNDQEALDGLKSRLTVKQIGDIVNGRDDHGVTVHEAGLLRRDAQGRTSTQPSAPTPQTPALPEGHVPVSDLLPDDGSKPYGTPGSRWRAPLPGPITHVDGRTGKVTGAPNPMPGGGHSVPVTWDEPSAPAGHNPADYEDLDNALGDMLDAYQPGDEAKVAEDNAVSKAIQNGPQSLSPDEAQAARQSLGRFLSTGDDSAPEYLQAEDLDTAIADAHPDTPAEVPDRTMGGGPGNPAWDRMMPSEVQAGDTISHPTTNRPIQVTSATHGPTGVNVGYDDNGTERHVLLPHHTPVARTLPTPDATPADRTGQWVETPHGTGQVTSTYTDPEGDTFHTVRYGGGKGRQSTKQMVHDRDVRSLGSPATGEGDALDAKARTSNAESVAGDNLPKGYGIVKMRGGAGPTAPNGRYDLHQPVHDDEGAIGPPTINRDAAKQAIRDHAAGRMRNGADALRTSTPDASPSPATPADDPVEWDANADKPWSEIHPDFKSTRSDGTRTVIARTRNGGTTTVPWRGPEGRPQTDTAQRGNVKNKPVGAVVHVRQPGGTQRLGTVVGVDGQHRHVELNPIGGGTRKDRIRIHASQLQEVDKAPSSPAASSPSGRSAKMQRAFQAASEGDHEWLASHGFDAQPGDKIHVSDTHPWIGTERNGNTIGHAVNGNGQGKPHTPLPAGAEPRLVHEPRTGSTAMPTGSAPDGGVRGTQSSNPAAKAMTERILANREAAVPAADANLDKYGVPADKTNQQLGTATPTLPADHRQIADDLKMKYMVNGPEHDRGISDDLRRYYLLNNQGGRDEEAAYWLRSAEEQAARKDGGGVTTTNTGTYQQVNYADAAQRIDEALRDGGNAHYNADTLDTGRVQSALRDEPGDYVTVKPPGGYEVSIRRADAESLLRARRADVPKA